MTRPTPSAVAQHGTPTGGARHVYADNLKVTLVGAVVVAHVVMAWSGLEGAWVLSEPPVREPLLTLLRLLSVVGVLFGMPLFFLVAGMFTPASLARKGFRRFALDRTVRLLVPSLLYVLVLSPPVEFVDPDNTGWSRGYGAFVVHVWTTWPPPPGPTWFLGVLLVLSLAYGLVRAVVPAATGTQRLRGRVLLVAGAAVALVSFLLRTVVPLGHEVWHLSLAQAPAWVAGFTLGVLGGERGWFEPLDDGPARTARRVAWPAMAGCAALVAAVASSGSTEPLFGGGTWQSLAFTAVEGAVVVTAPLWLLDLFRRRFDRQTDLGRQCSRAAYSAFVLHQGVLVALVLAIRRVGWAPEVELLGVAAVGVCASFLLGAVLVRLPGLSRVLG